MLHAHNGGPLPNLSGILRASLGNAARLSV
jgi:hypothetical protein